jgi:hypothetical protein
MLSLLLIYLYFGDAGAQNTRGRSGSGWSGGSIGGSLGWVISTNHDLGNKK